MKKTALIALVALALATPAFANTVWGTVQSASASSLSLSSANSDSKNIPSECTLTITDRTQFKGIGGADQLSAGDKVKVNVEEKGGMMKAKSIEKVDSIPAGQTRDSNLANSASTSQTTSANQTNDASAGGLNNR